MKELWDDLMHRARINKLSSGEKKFFKKFIKAIDLLQTNPKHNSLNSHEIEPLTKKYGIRIFQSYLENRTPAAGRIFWMYGPEKGEITVLGAEPHPESAKQGAYDRVKLSKPPKK